MANFAATSDIYFSWSRNITLGARGTEVPKDPVNLVATSSRFGVIFVANGSELQCTSVPDVENEHSIDKILPDSTTHVFFNVPAGGVINGVFMSADETTVAVCTENLFCHLFDTRALFEKTPHAVGPYFTVRLGSSPDVALKDFAFNPVIPDMFAVVISDGKVTNYEIASSNGQFTLKIHGSYDGVQCCSWSPKGKQLVVAKGDGSLVQLKPNMAEAKVIPPPTVDGLVNPKPKAIFWASSTVFVVAYWTNRLEVVVTILNKNAPTTYIPFEEPCLRNLDEEEFSRTWFCHIPKWNLLLMVCRNSPDVALFGHNDNCTQWTYYDIEGERAALPIISKNATYPTGICLNLSSTKAVEKKNQSAKPPSPMILLTNTGGSLSPYYLINDSATERINSPPEPKSTQGIRRMLNPLSTTPKAQTETPVVGAVLSKSKVNLLKQFEQHEAEQTTDAKTERGGENEPPKAAPFSFSNAFTPSKPGSDPLAQSTPIAATTFLGEQPKLFGALSGAQPAFPKFSMPAPKAQETPKPTTLSVPTPASQAPVMQPPTQQMSMPMAPPASQPARRASPVKVAPKLETIVQASEEDDSLSQETLSRAFFNELNSLTRELGDLKMRSSEVLAIPIGEEKSVTEMRCETKALLKKMDDVRNDLKTMKMDVHEAEKVLIDALACGTQLRTITAAKDSRISRMDPITTATLKQAQGLAQYLERQLINANNVLDDAYEKYRNEKNTRKRTPTMEMLCRTILKCDTTIEALRDELQRVRNKVDGIKRTQSLRERRNEDLTSLADSLLVVGIDSQDANETLKGSSRDHQSFEKIKLLKNYLASRPVTEVTPTKLSPHGESMIVSKLSTILEQSRIEVAAEKAQPSHAKPQGRILTSADNMPRESLGGVLGLRPQVDPSAVTPMKPPSAAVTSTPFSRPILEPISPPADVQDNKAATSSFFQFAKPAPTALAFPKASPDKPTFGFHPTIGSDKPAQPAAAEPAGAAQPFTFNLQKTPETQNASSSKPKVSFSFDQASASKRKEGIAEPSTEEVGNAPSSSASPGSMFTFATSTATAKPQASPIGTDFSFAVKKGPSPSKDFFSPATLGFSLTKKEEALAGTSPSKPDSAASQTVPVAGDKPAAATGTGIFSFSLGDKKQDATAKDPPAPFSFSFAAKPASDQGAEKTDKPSASPFKLGDSGSQFSFAKGASFFSTASKAEEPKSTDGQTKPSDPQAADKPAPAASPFSFGVKPQTESKPAAKPETATEAQKVAFSFGLGGSTTGFGGPKAATEASKSVSEASESATEVTVSETTSTPTTTTTAETESTTVGSEESTQPCDTLSEPVAFAGGESATVPGSTLTTIPATLALSASETSPGTEESHDAQVPSSAEISAIPASTTSATATSFFATTRPLNLTGSVPSGSTGAPDGASSLFGKPASGGLFGKAPSGGLFGSTASSTFGQSSAFGATPGTSLFGGSSTTTTTSFFGATLATTASPAATVATASPTKPFGVFGSQQTVTDSTAQPSTAPTATTTAPLFGSQSTYGQPSVFGSQSGSVFAPATTTSAFGPATTTSAFAPTTVSSAFAGSGIAFGSTTTPSPAAAFGQTPAFGAQAKPQTELFGKTMTPNSGSLFGQKSTFSGSNTGTSLFGGNTSSPSGGFMGGLGQIGTQTTRNVFGGSTTFGQNPQSTNLFGSGASTAFGAQPTYGGAAALGSPTAPKSTFGGGPTFGGGSPGGFGSAPTFGSAPVFGSTATFGAASPTSAFANAANAPTFGSLAQTQPTFGNAATGGTFGPAPGATPVFPAAAATSPKSAAFTQYRG